ncbi:hypothetical protein H072_10023 [Dactylellina haptotyla CBS 200.50]|uniref:Prion-inhibition and propagation HeLo domain-containing protein n=1 Tax=Dactylellina haptotyla (strain CBS 200.50) TaxID=1284197 RepID=S8BML0_DACHA|nr:hypothetical protein H072_10023 [Dactylellina haptotyla CBS 200.50]
MKFAILAIYVTLLFIKNSSGFLFTSIDDLAKEPTLATGDTSEYRIPIDGEVFASWEGDVDNGVLIELFLDLYWQAAKEWDHIFYGEYISGGYNSRRKSIFDRIDELNYVLDDIYTEANNVDMLNQDFAEDTRNTKAVQDAPRERSTADHLHLLFQPRFRGPSHPDHREGVHIRSRYEEVARYLLNALEVSAEQGDDIRDHEFQFVVSNLDVSLEHKQVTVYLDPNKTTRMRNTMLKLRERLTKAKIEALKAGWEVRTQMGYMSSTVAGYEETHPGISKQWERVRTIITKLGHVFDNLIEDLDGMAEILRVLAVPNLPETDESLGEGLEEFTKDYTLDRTAQFKKASNLDGNEIKDYIQILQKEERPDGGNSVPLGRGKTQPDSIISSSGGSSDPSILQEIIPISIDLREQDSSRLPLPLPESFPQGSSNILSTDLSPSVQTNLLAGQSPGGINPPRRSIFSHGSRFSDLVKNN